MEKIPHCPFLSFHHGPEKPSSKLGMSISWISEFLPPLERWESMKPDQFPRVEPPFGFGTVPVLVLASTHSRPLTELTVQVSVSCAQWDLYVWLCRASSTSPPSPPTEIKLYFLCTWLERFGAFCCKLPRPREPLALLPPLAYPHARQGSIDISKSSRVTNTIYTT